MKQSTYNLLVTILLMVIFIGGAALLYQNVSADELLSNEAMMSDDNVPSNLAPDFSVLDADGNSVSLSDFRGTPVVLNFWATWCGPCQMEMPAFQIAWETFGDQVQFMIVNLTDGVSDTVESATAFIADAGFTFPVYFDTQGYAAAGYGTTAIPVTCFIDAEGNIVDQHIGMMTIGALEQGIQAILGN